MWAKGSEHKEASQQGACHARHRVTERTLGLLCSVEVTGASEQRTDFLKRMSLPVLWKTLRGLSTTAGRAAPSPVPALIKQPKENRGLLLTHEEQMQFLFASNSPTQLTSLSLQNVPRLRLLRQGICSFVLKALSPLAKQPAKNAQYFYPYCKDSTL